MKYRYKINFAALMIACTVLWSSCEKALNKLPESDLSDAGFWNTTNDLKIAANYFYLFLPDIYDNINANWSDDGFANKGANPISDGSRTVSAKSSDWDNSYKLIFNCNHLLEKSVLVQGDEKVINQYRGEARFFRAFAYSELIKRFGDVPLILRTYDVKDTLNQAHRTSRQLILNTIYADLDFAIANLPKASLQAKPDYGRITLGAALSLKARIALHEGTFKKYHNKGNPAVDLNLALSSATLVMNSGDYAMFTYTPVPDSSYYYLFQYPGEASTNKENILVRLYGENEVNPISSTNYVGDLGAGNNTTPTRAFMDAFLYKDGLPIGKSPLYKTPTSTLTEFEDRDPRLGMTVFNKTHWYYTALYAPNFSFAPTGYKVRKYFINNDFILKKSFRDNMVIRYPEVLLIYAEATFELNGTISDADLNKTINLIRARAKMPALTNAFVGTNGLGMLTEIRRERRTELGLEGALRYWDLIRWKTAEIELPKPILGIRFFASEYNPAPPTQKLTSDGFVIVQDATKRKFDPKRDYLWPLPTNDLGLNLNLGTNNPYWQ